MSRLDISNVVMTSRLAHQLAVFRSSPHQSYSIIQVIISSKITPNERSPKIRLRLLEVTQHCGIQLGERTLGTRAQVAKENELSGFQILALRNCLTRLIGVHRSFII